MVSMPDGWAAPLRTAMSFTHDAAQRPYSFVSIRRFQQPSGLFNQSTPFEAGGFKPELRPDQLRFSSF